MKHAFDWFRVYHEARTDAKLKSLTDAQHRVWFDLLCFAAEQPDRGTIRYDDLDLLAVECAGGDTALLHDTLTRCAKLRIITFTPELVTFSHWDERQYDKPSDTPEAVKGRVTAHRQRQRGPQSSPARVTAPPPHVTEGVCNADVTRSNALDTDTDTEVESTPLPPTAADQGPDPFDALPSELDARRDRAKQAAAATGAARPIKCPTYEGLSPPFQAELQALIASHQHIPSDQIRRQVAWYHDRAGRELRTLAEWQAELRALVQNEVDKWLPTAVAPVPKGAPPRPVRYTSLEDLRGTAQ